jgi:endonuclease/exonuclease/phosphatase family metal-dependent hydrolase
MFKVMTWNLENLFRPGEASGPSSQVVYEAKLEGLASLIDQQAPDAVGVQEVGDPAALADLVTKLDGSWHTNVSQHPDVRGIRVAWISRAEPSDVKEIIKFPSQVPPVTVNDAGATLDTMGRGALAITVRAPAGQDVHLVTAHLKSKLLTFPGGRFQPRDEDERAQYAVYALDRRAAEAATLRIWMTAALGDEGETRALVLTGDLNDTEQAATTQILLGPPGSEIGTAGFKQSDQGDAQRLWNLAPRMPADRNYSRINQGRHELIDHILVSATLVKPLEAITVGAVIPASLPSVTPDPNARRDKPSSDHAPVIATFDNM